MYLMQSMLIVYELKMSVKDGAGHQLLKPVVAASMTQFFWGAMPPQDLVFKA